MGSRVLAIALPVALTGAAALLALAAGERWLSPFAPTTGLDETILWQLRWPRVQSAAAVGALLALAGAALQVLLGNPLAEPYVLGVAGSSSVGAIGGLLLGPQAGWPMSLGAFAGACAGVAATLPFARLGPHRLLLAGVVMAALWGAAVTLLLALLPERELGRALGWMMGNLAGNPIPMPVLWTGVVVVLLLGWALAPDLDRLLLGETHAADLGTRVRRARLGTLLLASTATALAVTAAGTIGFVGLVVPHTARLLVGPLHRAQLPVVALGGASLLMLADTGARVLASPAELPVGAVTAIVGVPLFLWLLVRRTSWS
ncbi:MAG: iron ABC transporter permease [Proteobacteria bacterium]|nr:iron ABC transporter permease [Pseudomonadota bacterium]